jgi:cellulose synthase/poly-beta-1,6-N-acetylglucosamine synthase-like glycosyltransferase
MSFTPIALLFMIVLFALAIYAAHAGTLLLLSLRRRAGEGEPYAHSDAPRITVQIPIYNERYVVERAIRSAASLDYPRERLQIQILDDSTDETSALARRAVEEARLRGLRIELLRRRNERRGYKAGALADGLASADGEFIAIFDADFMPKPNFLRRLVRELGVFDDPAVGFAQTRWTFLNRDRNALTRAQGLLLDKHFLVEQPARSASGLLFNFNGSGGIWRRTCLLDAGGWQEDTLTEDLDLSYRAQLRGWRGLYLESEMSPGDLPDSIVAFKRQQRRWARGSAQCLRKLLPSLLRAPLACPQKIAAALQLGGYLCQLFIFLFVLLWPHWAMSEAELPSWMQWWSLGSLGVFASFHAAHRRGSGGLLRFLRDLPLALGLAAGVSFSNAVAFLGGLFSHRRGEFERTPKGAPDDGGSYPLAPDWTMWVELTAAAYGFFSFAVLCRRGDAWSALPMLFYGVAFAAVAEGQLRMVLAREELAMRQPLPLDDP